VTEPDLDRIARRFPLVPRPRPAQQHWQARLAEISELAGSECRDPSTRLARTAAAHNLAALLAADCGHHELARTLCWLHHDRYSHDHAWTVPEARHALEPLVNLARLHISTADPDAALALLDTLRRAAQTRTITWIDSRRVDLRSISDHPGDQRALAGWLWTVHLGEGVRALARAGRWHDALAHAARLQGIGRRMLDGRQTAVVFHALDGATTTATALVGDTDVREPWERAVAGCLRVLALRRAGQPATAAASDMIDSYAALQLRPHIAHFAVQLGVTVVDLAPQGHRARVVQRSLEHATLVRDGRLARDILASSARNDLHGEPFRLLREAAADDASAPDEDTLRTALLTGLAGRVVRADGIG
jgi:hypothetical protein